MTRGAVAAACGLARSNGLDFVRPIVLADAVNVVIWLAPAPVVARVVGEQGRRRGAFDYASQELKLVSFLAAAGAPVAPPSGELPAGPHEHEGFIVTFWEFIEHTEGRLEPATAARSLRQVHQALLSYDRPLLSYDLFAEVDALLADDTLAAPRDLDALRRVRARITVPRESMRPLHGDVNLGNVLPSRRGHLWTDFESACLGPVEYDLSALEWEAQWTGSDSRCREFLRAYGPYDRELVLRLVPLTAVLLTTWNLDIARRVPEALPVARQRLNWFQHTA
jgi:hypothetical protein